jgi:hypothetical protein
VSWLAIALLVLCFWNPVSGGRRTVVAGGLSLGECSIIAAVLGVLALMLLSLLV